MSILINGMKMPKDCIHCNLVDGEYGGCLVDGKSHGDPNEPDDCPLTELPPHGDLIDRDALIEALPSCTGDDEQISKLGAIRDVIILAEEAPTIVEADGE